MLRRPDRFILCAIALCAAQATVAGTLSSGLWYSPEHSGHGMDIQQVGDQHTVVFYSFEDSNQPIWYLTVATEDKGLLSGDFGLYHHDPSSTPAQQLVAEPGHFSIDPTRTGAGSACEHSEADAGERAVFSWTLDDQSGQWCITPLLNQDNPYQQDHTGLWYAGSQDQGWGLSLDFQGPPEARTEVAILFYYDAEGQPRWAYGQTSDGGPDAEIAMQSYRGYCRLCEPLALTARAAGPLDHRLTVEAGVVAGEISMSITYPDEPGGQWLRSDSPLVPLSNPEPGLLPLPDLLQASQMVALIDVTVVPMTEGLPSLQRQDVLLADGVITQIEPTGQMSIPSQAVIIDARDLYLSPGLSEMHLHVTVGGQQAAEEAGLLLIANGVTTALNMGNSFAFNVPALSTRFESGQLIGPTLYSGQVAYGPSDGAVDSLTVVTPEGATTYAERLKTLGFDFIKTYWGLSPGVIRQLQQDSTRLGLPIIGHIPLNQPMSISLRDGQRMAAHIQEPYVTIMNRVRDEGLFENAANVFLEHGTWLTPTLAVFESYVLISGNRQDHFQQLIAREGQQYTHPSIRAGWQSYFNTGFIQNGDHEDLLDLLDFYKAMTLYFFEAGVPLLTGTDAPGFPGVMSGFGVHQEMRLLEEVGIPTAEVVAIATRNAGQFIDSTLSPTAGFGTVEIGKRADLILTDRHPLESLEHLERPIAVLSRGRFWSQSYLQQQLDALRIRISSIGLDDVVPLGDDFGMCGHH